VGDLTSLTSTGRDRMTSKVKVVKTDMPPSLFANNERVLCFHGTLIYEGKVIKVEVKDGVWNCFIHYAGWSKSWDEFVPETRVLKWTPENLQRQKEHKMAHEDQIRSSKKAANAAKPSTPSTKRKTSIAGDSTTSSANVSTTDSRPSTPTLGDQKPPKLAKIGTTGVTPSGKTTPAETLDIDASSKKRKRGENVETELSYLVKQEVQISLPELLKVFLVDDWDAICRQKKLLNIPSRHSVDDVLEAYKKSTNENDPDMYTNEVCAGIKEYFDSMLGSQLLYRFERSQYSDILTKLRKEKKDDVSMSSVYGPPHLLRLFTKLGTCLSYTTLDGPAIEILKKKLDDFFGFLLEHFDEYFNLEDYGVSAPEYQRKAPA